MLILFQKGIQRIVYKSHNFQAGLTVTAYFWSPTLVKSSEQSLNEAEDGLYYIDYNFNATGAWPVIFMEGGVKTVFTTIRVDTIGADVEFLKDVEGGRWKIVDNQMLFYESDNVTEVMRFDLFDAAGLPAITEIAERTRV